jgi:hypothetical protein
MVGAVWFLSRDTHGGACQHYNDGEKPGKLLENAVRFCLTFHDDLF